MANDKKFIDGLIVKAPNERAPDYVKAKLSIKNAELIAFLQKRLDAGEEWTNADVKVSQGGKWYAALDEWRPENGGGRGQQQPAKTEAPAPTGTDFADDDIPF